VKDVSLLVWLTQLGLSVVLPLAGFTLLGVWLHQQLQWGRWVVIAGAVLGIICAADGLRVSLKAMKIIGKDKKEESPPVSFNDHD
jgi:hypothetical protein